MSREEEDVWIIIKCIGCPIAMVNVKVYYHHPLQSMLMLSVPSRNRNVPKDTKAHGTLRNSMMSWRPY